MTSSTPLFDLLTKHDQKVVDYYVGGQAKRVQQIKTQGHDVSFDRDQHLERAAELVLADGATAEHLRNTYDAAHPSFERSQKDIWKR